MFKIAILGVENSHADAFAEFIKGGLYPDVEIFGVYSDEKDALDNFAAKYGVKAMTDYAELVGKVDGIMITARHGKIHYLYAEPYMKTGIPMFIDKPITVSVEDAENLVASAKKYGVRLCGGSTCGFVEEVKEMREIMRNGSIGKCIGGSVIAPLCYSEQYGGFFFYAQHLVQILINVFGTGVEDVYAVKDKYHTYTVMFRYKNFIVSGNFAGLDYSKMYYFDVTAYGSEKVESRNFDIEKNDFHHEMTDMLDLLNGKPQKQTFEEFIYPVYLLNAIEKSAKINGWVKVK